jgi:hypothetical protein
MTAVYLQYVYRMLNPAHLSYAAEIWHLITQEFRMITLDELSYYASCVLQTVV